MEKAKKIKTELDMTHGKLFGKIVSFTLPVMLTGVLQLLFNAADMAVVGQLVSDQALAAVGSTNSLVNLILNLFMGLSVGTGVAMARCYGAKNKEYGDKILHTSLPVAFVSGIVVMIIGVFTSRSLLELMNTPDNVIDLSTQYLTIYFLGAPFNLVYNFGASVMRSTGDSKRPLLYLTIAGIVNVIINIISVVVFKMGVAGVAYATIMSQAISAVGCFVVMFAKFPVYRIKARHFISSVKFYWQHVALGLPMALQFSIIAVGIMVQQSALNQLGSVVVTAYTAANKIDSIVNQSLAALGSAVATFCGQNYGAMRFDRIRQGVKLSMIVGVFCSLIGFAFVALLAQPLTRLFSSEITQEILDYSQQYLIWQGAMYVFLTAIYVYRNALQGIGKSTFAMLGGAIEVAMRVLASLLLTKALGYTGICVSNPAAWIGADIFFVISYMTVIRGLRRKKGIAETKEEPVDGDHILLEGKTAA